jgi:two-component system sensor histidine kinase RpfC
MSSSLRQPRVSIDCVRDALEWTRHRLRGRPDSEHEMTPNRMVFAGSVVLYLLIATRTGDAAAAAVLQTTYKVFIIYFITSLLVLAHILCKPQVSARRRMCAMACDFGMISYAAAAGGMGSGFFYPFYLWTVFGNGFRFGVPYLYAAMVMANAGFVTVLYTTGTWHQHSGLSIALLSCLIMLPLYAAKLIRKLSEAKHHAEEANRAKSAFLASVSHEVRTPLNAIIGLGDLLHDQLRNPERRHMVSTIVSSGRSLLTLINSILDFSRIEAGRMPSKVVQIDLYEAMGQLKAMLAAQTKSQTLTLGVHITARTPAHILADYSHIERILINLAANAIKFTEKGFVVVTVDAIKQDGVRFRLRFEVSDTGIGIPADAQDRIFESFVQADATIIDRYGGTGLGLAISKQLVSLLNGRMGLESAVGKGSTFWFEVDVTSISADYERSEISKTTAVLFSRDNEIMATLENAGISVIRTTRPEQVEAAVCGSQSTFGYHPVVFVDHRELAYAPEGGVKALGDLRDITSGLVLVTDEPRLSGLSVPLRSMFATTLVRPVEGQFVRHAVRLARLAQNNLRADRERAEVFAPAARPLSVLVAEDNRTNQMVIVKTLERVGHTATVVNDGEAALDALEENHFDVVLMDLNMPVMNGIDATKLYRFCSIGQPHVPIVALTADATTDAWARCKEAGMDGYVTKPIEPARLLDVIDSVLSRPEVIQAQHVEDKTVSLADRIAASKIENLIERGALADLESLGGHAFVSGLVSQFSNDAAELLSSLRVAVAEDDVQRFRDAAHALRGSAANLGAARVFESCLALRAITPSQLALEGEAQVSRLVSDVDHAIDVLKAHVASDNADMCGKAQPSRHRRNPSEPVSSSRKRAGITAKRRNAGVPRGADAGLEPIASDSCGGGQPPLISSWSPPTYQ